MRWCWLVALAGCSSSPAKGGDAAPADLAVTLPPEDGGARDGAGARDLADAAPGACPGGMVRILNGDAGLDFCVDPWEGYVVEITDGGERDHSPFLVIGTAAVRARSASGVYPQGYISQLQATAACNAAGKRLCSATEFAQFCRGPDQSNWYPYGGEKHIGGYCNEGKGSSMSRFFGNDATKWTYDEFNDPRLNQWDGGLAPTGSYPHCVSPYGIYDCVGNLHEWGSDPADANGHGRFRGGFYGDAELNGPGCRYVTSAHGLSYHDYSTGFRCCADSRP